MGKRVTVGGQEVDIKDWGEFWELVKTAKDHVTLKDDYFMIDVDKLKKVMVQGGRLWYKIYLQYYIIHTEDPFSEIFRILSNIEYGIPYWRSMQIHKKDGVYYIILTYLIDDDTEFVVHYVSLYENINICEPNSLTKPIEKIVKDLQKFFEKW
jgi:hypothetical protein